MSVKNYIYYPPINPQFFFPKKKFSDYKSYYTPYSLKSKIFWSLFSNFSPIRNLFSVSESKIPFPTSKMSSTINCNIEDCFYNIGTKGPEQKTTIIANKKLDKVFLKIAYTPLGRKLVEKEAKTLENLKQQKNIKTPQLLKSGECGVFSFLMTELIEGKKIQFFKMNPKIFSVLIALSVQHHQTDKHVLAYSHGDFCPWNMLMDKNEEVVLVDWEMAAFRPLGFDLFTYIFQTNFLINPRKKIDSILSENKQNIIEYFNYFGITTWNYYLREFAVIKEIQEREKTNNTLHQKYIELLGKNYQN